MTRWLVVWLACLGCSGKKRDCPPVKVVVAQRDAGSTDALRAQVEEDLLFIERGLDCAHLARASAPELVPIQSALLTLEGRVTNVPPAVATALQPVIVLYDANLGLLSGPSPKIGAWCKTMRDAVAKVKQDLPPLWIRAPEPVVVQPASCR